MKLLDRYKNGNYTVTIFDDGTKIRNTKDDKFNPVFPESIDCKITNVCDMNCAFCHEDSKEDGKHGKIVEAAFFNTLHPYTELAIGGGNPLCHPDIIPFLEMLKERKIIANITVNQHHFMAQSDLIKWLVDNELIYGLGVSLTDPAPEFISNISKYPNAVIHVINGIVDLNDLKSLYDKNLKLLILGYKEFRRGSTYYSKSVEDKKALLSVNLEDIVKYFDVVSFDNLAIKQLNPRRIMTEEQWDSFYMGDDGQFTMYIDLVNEEFAQSSTAINRCSLKSNIVDMFNIIREGK